MRSNLDFWFLPSSNSAGETPVVVWGVIRYQLKKRETLVSKLPSFDFFIPSLKIWTALSASPFDEKWYGAVLMCRIPFRFRKSLNSSLTKLLPLSVTNISGSPWVEKAILNFSMVALDVEVFTGNASSGHLLLSRTFYPEMDQRSLGVSEPKAYAATPRDASLATIRNF